MPAYRVTWQIDLEADSPVEAAWSALNVQENPLSEAHVFQVDELETGTSFRVDIEETEEGKACRWCGAAEDVRDGYCLTHSWKAQEPSGGEVDPQ